MKFAAILLFATAALALSQKPHAPKPGMRLIKTSEQDPGTWVTEDEKFEKYFRKHIHFADITDSWDLEDLGAERRASLARRQSPFPAGPSHQSVVNPLLPQLKSTTIRDWMTTYTAYFNRHYTSTTGQQSATWLFDTVKSVASANPNITVAQFSHAPSFNQQSIIAKIPGRTSKVVVVSAHLDSVGSTRTGRAPGADDNASGSLTILETMRVLANAKFTPENTLEFHWYAGEEGGLLGSRGVMRKYATDRVNVVATLNQDMTGYSPNNVVAVIQDYVSAPLSAFVKTVVEEYADIPVITTQCGYACSDHASATSSGYASSFVFEDDFDSSNPYIHSAQDTMDRVNFNHVMEHAKLTLGFAIEASYF